MGYKKTQVILLHKDDPHNWPPVKVMTVTTIFLKAETKTKGFDQNRRCEEVGLFGN